MHCEASCRKKLWNISIRQDRRLLPVVRTKRRRRTFTRRWKFWAISRRHAILSHRQSISELRLVPSGSPEKDPMGRKSRRYIRWRESYASGSETRLTYFRFYGDWCVFVIHAPRYE